MIWKWKSGSERLNFLSDKPTQPLSPFSYTLPEAAKPPQQQHLLVLTLALDQDWILTVSHAPWPGWVASSVSLSHFDLIYMQDQFNKYDAEDPEMSAKHTVSKK